MVDLGIFFWALVARILTKGSRGEFWILSGLCNTQHCKLLIWVLALAWGGVDIIPSS